jgi:hypothetical protein
MFKVQYRTNGLGPWNLSAAPMTMQAALGHARAVNKLDLGKDIQVVPGSGVTSEAALRVDLLV